MRRRQFLTLGAHALAGALGSWALAGVAVAEDPYRAYNITLLIEGEKAAQFLEASGLGVDVDVIEYREGGAEGEIRELPGQVRYQPLELRYGISQSTVLWDWLSSALTGDQERRAVSIVMLDNDDLTEAFRWTLTDAWVVSWQAAHLDAATGELAIESMTIVYDGLERE